jgi:Uma2 family endonuclease
MTPEQFLALPEEKPYLEYVHGVVLQKPTGDLRRGQLAAELATEIRLYARQHGGHAAVEARTAASALPNYRLPDVSYWAPGRRFTDDSLPTLAVEVRSPGQTMAELREKCRFFRANGVDACWLIDPDARTAEIFEGEHDGVIATGALTAAALPGFELALGALFAVLES